MRYKKVPLMILGIVLAFSFQPARAIDIIDNYSNWIELESCKNTLDDPRGPLWNVIKSFGEMPFIGQLTFDVEKGSAIWAGMIGFKSPDVVGKIVPEIKPGKYTLADKARLPFKDLMVPMMYERFNQPGGQGNNFCCKTSRNSKWFQPGNTGCTPPLPQPVKSNEGKTKLDGDGYIDYDSYEGGIPFPKPSGSQIGWQILYDYLESYTYALGEDYLSTNGSLRCKQQVRDGSLQQRRFTMSCGFFQRVIQEPKGAWYDNRAKNEGTKQIVYYEAFEPRDLYGNAYMLSKARRSE